MKRHKKKVVFITLLLLVVFVSPYLIDLGSIGSAIEKKAGNMYGTSVNIETMAWHWLPFPGIYLNTITLDNSEFNAEIGSIEISPSLLSFITGNPRIRSIEIDSPKVRIKSVDALLKTMSGEKEEQEIPDLDIYISGGELSVPFNGHLKPLKGNIKPLEITGINLVANTGDEEISLSASLNTPYTDSLSTKIILTPDPVQKTFFWDIKSDTRDVDLSQIRKALLIVFKDDETVRDVFEETVTDGRVVKAGFSFRGTSSDFSNLDKMVLTADVGAGKVHIPETNIFLYDVRGSLKIEHSVLTGKNLSTRLKNSFGTNGTLFLGLAEDDFRFKLKVDIDDDLSELQGVIDEFIEPSEFKKQLAGIKNLTGRTLATLTLGDNLNNIQTDISLPSLSGKFHYDFLQRDITLKGGALTISPDSVSWQNLSCDIGPNAITNASGSVGLIKDSLLNLTASDAQINSSDLYELLSSWPKIKKVTRGVLKGIEGAIELSDIRLNGPVNQPEAMTYGFNANSSAVIIDSPILPKPSSFSFGSATVSDEKIIVNQMKATFKDSVFSVSTKLRHSLLSRFTGSVIINGVAGKELAPWLGKKDWLHESFLPKLPCNLSPLSFLLTDNAISITGNLLHKKRINTIIDVKVEGNSRTTGTFEIISGKEGAAIQIHYPEKPDNHTIKVGFDGEITKATMTSVIDNEWLPGDTLKGKFDLLHPLGKEDAIQMTGSAEIGNFRLTLDNNGAVLIDNLKITGKNDYADLTPEGVTIIPTDNLKSIITENLAVSDLKSRVYFQHLDSALLKIFSGAICGVTIAGDLGIPSKKLDFKLSTEKEDPVTFDEFFSCLGINQVKITGGLSITANIKGTPTNISGSTIKLNAVNGVVEKATLLGKILSLIDLTELFRKNPIKKLSASGYHYESIEIEAVIIGHTLQIVRAATNGSGLNLYGTGHIDLDTLEIDMVVLASPLKAFDSIFYSLPIIGKKFSGKNKSILSVPIKVGGSVGNPTTRFVPKKLTTVSSEIMDVFVKTFKIPFEFSYKVVKPDQPKETTAD